MCKKIICPHCGSEIKLESEDYASIVEQVRTEEFNVSVREQVDREREHLEACIQIAVANAKLEMQAEITKKEEENFALQQKNEALTNRTVVALRERDETIATLRASSGEEIGRLQEQLRSAEEQKNAAVASAIAAEQQRSKDKDLEIARLNEVVKAKETELNLEITNTRLSKDKEIEAMKAKMTSMEASFAERELALKNHHAATIRAKDEEIAFHKDFKSRLSTKMIGETLEEHCMAEYARIRPLLDHATFVKDTLLSESGSKGDFIFRDYDEDGSEFISIMFDAKNESDDSTHKHRNKDYFKELDKDRREKGCEYAVLVSTLESDSEIYNQGIVDVSDQYPKMYVVRPQCFIPIITILRNAARKVIYLKKEISELKSMSIDVSNFEEDLAAYKDSIAKSLELAGKKKDSAIEKIDKTIAILQSIKDDFTKLDQHLATAGAKSDKLTIKKLTSKSPTVSEALKDTTKTLSVEKHHSPDVFDIPA